MYVAGQNHRSWLMEELELELEGARSGAAALAAAAAAVATYEEDSGSCDSAEVHDRLNAYGKSSRMKIQGLWPF